jgi:methylglutaconyl-CoA hydratase
MKAAAHATFDQNLEERSASRTVRGVADFPKPVIARVHGNVLGGGVGLAVCVRHRGLVRRSALRLTEVRLGILPAIISPYVIRRLGDRGARAS